MKTNFLFGLSLLSCATLLQAQVNQPKPAPPPSPPPPPPPVATAPAQSGPPEKYVYDQKPLPGRPYLVTPEQAQTIINRFKDSYVKMGSPRILIYINRELVDETSGMKLSARREQTEAIRGDVKGGSDAAQSAPTAPNPANAKADGSAPAADLNSASRELHAGKGNLAGQVDKATAQNTYRLRSRPEQALADKQTVRDVERLFGRPLRMAGATLVDQRLATQLISDKPLGSLTAQTEGEPARKDREALAKIADVVLEILISSRQVTVSEISGDKVYGVPDIQATAIQLKDSKILGQASASDLVGQGPTAGKVARTFGVREITEATALALMEDLTQ